MPAMHMAGESNRVPVLSFDDLCDRESRLRELEREVAAFAAALPHGQEDQAEDAWYGQFAFYGNGFKARLVRLIGWGRNPPGYVEPAPMKYDHPKYRLVTSRELAAYGARCEIAVNEALARLPEAEREREKLLRTPFAYDVAYRHLFSVLTHGSPAM